MKAKFLFLLGVIAYMGSACSDEFLDHPSTTNPTIDTYYTNAEQVNGATGLLYNSVWNDWSDKAFISVGDVLGGTVTGMQGNAQYNSFYNFNIQSTDGLVMDTWKSCYKAAGQASVLIQAFEEKKKTAADAGYLNLGIAEARFIRGFAYFYIARTFGDAPIVDNPLDMTKPGSGNVPRYIQKDVLRFALEDLKYAEANLPDIAYQDGRVTRYSAKGLMAKIYLYSKDYENARAKAKEVIDYAESTGRIGLMADYNGMFTSSVIANYNNRESLFSLRWLAAMGWNGGNRYQLYVGPQPLLKPLPTGGSGYSAVVPSFDVLNASTGYEVGDKRRSWSIMEHGFHKSEWINENFPEGFTYDTTGKVTDDHFIFTPTRTNIQKYVVGPNRSGEIVTPDSHSSMCTYILRYADVLLIYSEAILAGAGSTSDANALKYFNMVRHRAGFGASADKTALTIDDILHERKVEFAFEGDYWFDIQRQGFTKAQQMIAAQERGTLGGDGKLTSFKASITSPSQLFLPIPQSETVSDPALLEPAVPYYK